MNKDHYPSLELCKKLKEIGFPETEKTYWNSDYETIIKDRTYWINKLADRANIAYPCPSAMEMLDVMPKMIKLENTLMRAVLFIEKNEVYYKEYSDWNDVEIKYDSDSLPNNLASIIIWLKENKHINFK